MDVDSKRSDNRLDILQDPSSEPQSLPLEYLREITNNFSDERLLGKGTFGNVYKGLVQNGDILANGESSGNVGPTTSCTSVDLRRCQRGRRRGKTAAAAAAKEEEEAEEGKKREEDMSPSYIPRLTPSLMIAVKKFTFMTPEIQDKQFENEVRHLMELKHPNIVQLVGYCSEAENTLVQYNGKLVYAEMRERLLCLEYLPKGSLHEHLSDESSGLDWNTRYKIIQGICSGLQYLHEKWRVNAPIIHMDLKPPNILLDENMMPKIADFGLSRLFGAEQTRISTTSRDGTLGYMAPEYLNRGIITKKLDIFSLGVIIIEIMTGRKDYPYETTETSSQKFIEPVIKNWKNRLKKLPKYALWKTDCQQIRRCIQIGLACVKSDWKERPTICQIIEMLHGNEKGKSTISNSSAAAMARSSVVSVPLIKAHTEKQSELRRGTWTKEEVRTLIVYIAKHGEPGKGSWDSVARNAGLKRTGSSCEVRWLNYIRPDVKHGSFTAEEQLLILENRRSWIERHLPGPIDNGVTKVGAEATRQLASQGQAAQARQKQKKK
ncbi:hypothetical protein ACP4OV_022786 [Aristida adscensionis]